MVGKQSLVILSQEACCEYLCDFAAVGFIVDPEGNLVPGGAYCEQCAQKIVAEYKQKVSPKWRFQGGDIVGDAAARTPSPPSPPVVKVSSKNAAAAEDCSFLSYVVDRLTPPPGSP